MDRDLKKNLTRRLNKEWNTCVIIEDVHSVKVMVEMKSGIWVQILDEPVVYHSNVMVLRKAFFYLGFFHVFFFSPSYI